MSFPHGPYGIDGATYLRTSRKGSGDDLKERKYSEAENDQHSYCHPKARRRGLRVTLGNLSLGHDLIGHAKRRGSIIVQFKG